MAVEDLKQAEGAMRGQLDFVLAYEAKVEADRIAKEKKKHYERTLKVSQCFYSKLAARLLLVTFGHG